MRSTMCSFQERVRRFRLRLSDSSFSFGLPKNVNPLTRFILVARIGKLSIE